MAIVVASTCAAYKCKNGEELNWLQSAQAMQDLTPHDLDFFCAVQIGQGHDENFRSLQKWMESLGGTIWTFSVNTGDTEVTSASRLNDICMGRNLALEYAQRKGATHILFLDTDLRVDADCLVKLLEVDHALVGGNVPSYCLDGPPVFIKPEFQYFVSYEGGGRVHTHPERPFPEGVDLRAHWNTAGFLLVQRRAFTKLRWRYDSDSGMTDDPSFAADAASFGFGNTWVRHDVIGDHEPLVPMEVRGYNRSIDRSEN